MLQEIRERIREIKRGATCLEFGPRFPAFDQDTAIDVQRAGRPDVRITVDEPYDLGEEFFRWQFATAVADSIRARLGPDTSVQFGARFWKRWRALRCLVG